MNIGFLNVRSLKQSKKQQYRPQSARMERLYEYTEVFASLQLDIVGLAETRIQGLDNMWTNAETGYTFCFSGATHQCKTGGVAIGYRAKALARKGVDIINVHPVDERMMAVWGCNNDVNFSIIS